MAIRPGKVEDLLGKLTDEMSIEPLVYQLFELNEPERVKQIVEELNSCVIKKNTEIKKMLSTNHQHLFSCTDLIDQLKSFNQQARANQEKLQEFKNLKENRQENFKTENFFKEDISLKFEIEQELLDREILAYLITSNVSKDTFFNILSYIGDEEYIKEKNIHILLSEFLKRIVLEIKFALDSNGKNLDGNVC